MPWRSTSFSFLPSFSTSFWLSSEFAFVDTITLLLFYAIFTVSNSSKHSSISVLVRSSPRSFSIRARKKVRLNCFSLLVSTVRLHENDLSHCFNVIFRLQLAFWKTVLVSRHRLDLFITTVIAGPFYYNCNWYKYKTMSSQRFKHQPHKMVKHTQKICRLFSTNCLIVFDHFVRLALNKFTAEGFSETRPFMHVSKHVFWSQ